MTLSFLVFSVRQALRPHQLQPNEVSLLQESPDFLYRLLHRRRPILLKEGSTNLDQVSSNPFPGTRVPPAGSCLVGIGFKDGETLCCVTRDEKNEGVAAACQVFHHVSDQSTPQEKGQRVNSSLRAAKNFNTNPLGMGPKNPLPVLAHAYIQMVATSKSSPTRRTVVSTTIPRENVPPTSRTSKGRARESKPSPLCGGTEYTARGLDFEVAFGCSRCVCFPVDGTTLSHHERRSTTVDNVHSVLRCS